MMEEDAMDVLVAQASLLLNQPPSVVRKQTVRDLELVFTVKEAYAELEKQEMDKNKSGGKSVLNKRK